MHSGISFFYLKNRRHECLLLLVALFFLLVCGCSNGVFHTVKPGQTLYRISKTYGIDEEYLARLNRVQDPAQLKVGARLYIPGANKVLTVPVVKTQAPVNVRKPKPPVKVTPVAKPSVSTSTVKPSAAPSVKPSSLKKLEWPLRGKVVRSFSKKAQSGGGKGIEISVRDGSSVYAAEAGKVIYSGDGVNGYGHLIILQHESDLFTVYGFNRKNTVKQGDYVSKGEKIALSGVPPSGGQPRLHFEVRKGKQAVDPILYLP